MKRIMIAVVLVAVTAGPAFGQWGYRYRRPLPPGPMPAWGEYPDTPRRTYYYGNTFFGGRQYYGYDNYGNSYYGQRIGRQYHGYDSRGNSYRWQW